LKLQANNQAQENFHSFQAVVVKRAARSIAKGFDELAVALRSKVSGWKTFVHPGLNTNAAV
jgi:hypothetical protein